VEVSVFGFGICHPAVVVGGLEPHTATETCRNADAASDVGSKPECDATSGNQDSFTRAAASTGFVGCLGIHHIAYGHVCPRRHHKH